MQRRTRRSLRSAMADDVGTLWRMHREERSARCALLVWPGGDFELKVLVDGLTLLTERCGHATAAFALGEEWKRRMLAQGWRQVVPGVQAGQSL